ncbi:MAG: hypothetical protein ACTSYJ_06185 [Candidatus Thorarchaeota archaeon]
MGNIVIHYKGKFGSAFTEGLPQDTKEFIIWNMGITSIDLTPLADCYQLQRINLSGNNLKIVNLTPLSHCFNLNFLSLTNNDISQIDISPLFFCPNLGEVKLDFRVSQVADSRLKPLLPKQEGLKYLEISTGQKIQWKDGLLSPDLLSRLEQSRTPQTKPSPTLTKPTQQQPIMKKDPVEIPTEGVKILRGGEILGGKFEYKVKISNETKFVINNVTVTVVAYPQDCMEISGSSMKTISRIEPAGFRSPQFIFAPTKDCVEGQLLASVSYVDHENNLQMKSAEPYIIRSVCDLLKPLEKTPEAFEKLIIDMDSTSEKVSLGWNPEIIFTKAQKLLPIKNFHIIDSDQRTIGGHFTGTIRGFAEGKYTGKKVAVQALISGPIDGNQADVVIEGMGEDIAMLPTTIEEISAGIGSWICMNCGAAIDVDGVSKIKQQEPISCQYCRQTLTIELYRK